MISKIAWLTTIDQWWYVKQQHKTLNITLWNGEYYATSITWSEFIYTKNAVNADIKLTNVITANVIILRVVTKITLALTTGRTDDFLVLITAKTADGNKPNCYWKSYDNKLGLKYFTWALKWCWQQL